jgi:hypothetical protein
MSAPRTRVALYSPFSPDTGGGATNLRTLVPHLEGVDVDWLYTAPAPAREPGTTHLGPSIVGGSRWHDMSRMVALWSGLPTRSLRRVADAILARGGPRAWVVGHVEGNLVARALMRAGARVHLSIQDDVPDGVFARSQRYRLLAPLARPLYERTLRAAASIDVTSDGMQRHYRQTLGVDSVVVHPYVEALPAAPPRPALGDEIRVGHVGSIYAPGEWRALLGALRDVAAKQGRKARMVMIGLAPRYHAVAGEFGGMVELVSDLPEERAVERLFTCHAVYAMYPFDERAAVFRRTSLPTKLTTYLRAQRPILAHSPAGSSLLEIVEGHGLGVPCTGPGHAELVKALERLLEDGVAPGAYERARAEVYGVGNPERLGACLRAL